MKVYEVECRAVITLAAQDMQKAALHGAAVIKDNPHLIYVRAIHERNFEPAREDPSPENSQKESIAATLTFPRRAFGLPKADRSQHHAAANNGSRLGFHKASLEQIPAEKLEVL